MARPPLSFPLAPPTTRPGSSPLSSLTSSRFETDDAAIAAVLERKFVAAADWRRRPAGTIGRTAAAATLVGLTYWHPIAHLLGVEPRDAVIAIVPVAVASLTASAVHRLGGAATPQYRAIDAIESALRCFAVVALVYRARNVASPLWTIWFAHAFVAGAIGARKRLHGAVLTVSALGLAAALVVWRADYAGAVSAVGLGFLGIAILVQLSSAARATAETEIGWEMLNARTVDRRVESERGRLARDLHDGVGAELSALVWQARLLREEIDDDTARAEVDRFVERVQLGAEELRAAVWALRAGDEAWSSIASYVEARCRELVAPPTRVTFESESDAPATKLAGKLRTELLRIAQEGVRNAARHADASHVAVTMRMSKRDAFVEIEVRDDGRGLPASVLETSRGGLKNLRSRAERIGGDVEFAAMSPGTRVRVRAPLK